MPTINDANGTPVKINDNGQIYALSVIHEAGHHANQEDGLAYNSIFSVAPAGAGDCIFYLKNNSADDIIIGGVKYVSSAAEEIWFEIANYGTPVLTAGAIIEPANLNAGKPNDADCVCWSNIDGGAVDITGLSSGRVVGKLWITALADNKDYKFYQDITLPKNGVFTIWAVGGDTIISGCVHFYFHK